MNEFYILKTALERIEHELEIEEWVLLDEQLITDKDEEIDYWFRHGQLVGVDNTKEECGFY